MNIHIKVRKMKTAIANVVSDPIEVISTEDFLWRVHDCNRAMEKEK